MKEIPGYFRKIGSEVVRGIEKGLKDFVSHSIVDDFMRSDEFKEAFNKFYKRRFGKDCGCMAINQCALNNQQEKTVSREWILNFVTDFNRARYQYDEETALISADTKLEKLGITVRK